MIDLTNTRRTLAQANELIVRLDGKGLNDESAITSQARGAARQQRAQMSQDLQLLASRLELAAQLVRNEYWFARGVDDPLKERRKKL